MPAQDVEDYWPYPSKTVSRICKHSENVLTCHPVLLLDILNNMPHLQLSDNYMKTILWMLSELNVPNTPSLYALWETQKKLAEQVDIQPHEHISALGNKFHAVAPEDLLALVSNASRQV